MSFAPKMPGPISPPHPMAPPAGVAGAFHALHSGALAPRAGHALQHQAPGPMPHPAGAPMPLMTSGRPVAAQGHMPVFGGMAASANPMPARGFAGPTG